MPSPCLERTGTARHFTPMVRRPTKVLEREIVAQWPLSAVATLGSSIRAKGILLEIRAHLPWGARKSLETDGSMLVLHRDDNAEAELRNVSAIVSRMLEGIENLPLIPREIEDILSISAAERHKWLKDGRLPSAGTRTVRLRGRARQITFHVFDPRQVEDILDRDLMSVWREDDAIAAAENRRRAAWKAKLTRSKKKERAGVASSGGAGDEAPRPRLESWDEFEDDGLLR
ncbi:hypothetical protein GCM10007276_32710 [Agaricicola taiwanensis]|uniref:Uncharacterized protein n=1 Tax=Agaricicola taiwanensis TaxID=591372 RepID=A0A8J2YMT7_9RHOB|nr:hypothetical protein [Agaricicola taiwanensis]GGE53128.1 hypothetical protein GCM10007276_32710 [Agaricicola taiwanensis]